MYIRIVNVIRIKKRDFCYLVCKVSNEFEMTRNILVNVQYLRNIGYMANYTLFFDQSLGSRDEPDVIFFQLDWSMLLFDPSMYIDHFFKLKMATIYIGKRKKW